MTNLIVFVIGMSIVLYVTIMIIAKNMFGEGEDKDKKDTKSEVNSLLEEDVFVVNMKNTDGGSSQ